MCCINNGILIVPWLQQLTQNSITEHQNFILKSSFRVAENFSMPGFQKCDALQVQVSQYVNSKTWTKISWKFISSWIHLTIPNIPDASFACFSNYHPSILPLHQWHFFIPLLSSKYDLSDPFQVLKITILSFGRVPWPTHKLPRLPRYPCVYRYIGLGWYI